MKKIKMEIMLEPTHLHTGQVRELKDALQNIANLLYDAYVAGHDAGYDVGCDAGCDEGEREG